jgi:hypothetical protein
MSGRIFLYNASGVAIGGTISQPFKADIETNSATSLPIIGGFASAKSENYELKDVISFRSAHTYVSGIETADRAHHTVATCIVEGLNILDVITADAIIGRLSAKQQNDEQPEIIPLGSSFDNLKIAGCPVHVDLNYDLFLEYPTHSALLTQYESGSSAESANAPRARYQWGLSSEKIPPSLAEGMLMEPGVGWQRSNGVLYTSIVKQVRPVGTGNSLEELPYAYAIHIPQVGNLYLGELFASADIKRLCMLRLELGCPFAGAMAAGVPLTNGSWFP